MPPFCTENGKLLNCNVRENAWFLDKLDIHRLTSMGLVFILRLSLFLLFVPVLLVNVILLVNFY